MAGQIWLTDLADVLRAGGFDVTEVPGWKTRSAAPYGGQYGGPGLDSQPRGWVWHHTATNANALGDYPTYRTILDGNSQTGGPLVQLGMGRSGRLYLFAAGIAWHAGRLKTQDMYNYWSNRVAGGTEVESPGTPGTTWTEAQMVTAPKVAACLSRRYRWSATAWEHQGHKEVSGVGKIDPLINMDGFRKTVAGLLAGTVKTSPEPQAPSIPSGFQAYRPISVDGKWLSSTTTALQGLLGTPQDGLISDQLQEDAAHFPTCWSIVYGDGTNGGSSMWRALQSYLNRTDVPGKAGTPLLSATEKLTEDGLGGPASCRALQRWLRVTEDGVFGPTSTAALQRRVNLLSGAKAFLH